MRKTTRLLAVSLLGILALGTTVPTHAQTTKTLDEVVVTANKFPQKQSQTGKVITVIPDSVLQHYATQSVGELLARQAGIMIVGAQGPLGTNQDVYVRGANAGNTLILLDGIPVYDPSGTVNTFDLNLISVGQCERIEILKGAQSTAYGSDAVAGVIAISTRKAGKKPLGGNASVQYGSYNTFRGSVGLNGATDRLAYNVQYTRVSSTGFPAATDRDNTGTFANDGFRQNALLANLAYTLKPGLTLKLRGLHTAYNANIAAGAFTDEKDYTTQSRFNLGAVGLEWNHGPGTLTANYALTDSRRRYKNDSGWVAKEAYYKYEYAEYGGLTHFAEVYHTLRFQKQFELLTGADYRFANTDQTYFGITAADNQREQSPSLGADTARTGQGSLYASGVFRTENGLAIELGGRYNHHSIYGNAFTYSFNPSYLLANQVKVFVNVSSGFRAPVLYQLFSPYGNKALKPERSQSVEAGVQVFTKTKNAWLRILYFNRHIREAIFFQSLPDPPYGQYINFDNQYAHGLELEAQAQVKNLTLTGNLTLLGGRTATQVASRDTTFTNLFRQPRVMLNGLAGYQFNANLYANAAVRVVGNRVDRFFNDQTFVVDDAALAGYVTVDLYAEYRIGQFLRVFGDIRNLFDKTYTDIYGYNTRRRNGNMGFKLNF